MKASVFEDWVEEELLKKLLKDHVIIMDNAAFHKKEVLQNLAGKYFQRLIFLLPYSPESITSGAALKRKGCWLCSSLWLPFTGSGCRFRRQLAIRTERRTAHPRKLHLAAFRAQRGIVCCSRRWNLSAARYSPRRTTGKQRGHCRSAR